MGADFHLMISDACTREMKAAIADRDMDRIGGIIEALASALGKTVAFATHGDPKGIDTMLTGADAYAHEAAVEFAALVRATRGRPSPGGQS